MKRFTILLTAIFALVCFQQNCYAESVEEYKCDLMMKGYEFTNDGLSEAIIKNDNEAVRLFVKADININLKDSEGYNAIERAEEVNNEETILLLSKAGGEAKIKKTDKTETQQEKPQITKTEPETKENNTLNALCEYVNANELDEVAKTAKKSKYLNTLTEEGLAPIHYAIFNDNPAMVHLLLNAGADVNILTNEGLTPLDLSVLNNQKIIAKELLECGGALSENLAKELSKFGCTVRYDETFNLYDAEFEEIFSAMAKIQEILKN